MTSIYQSAHDLAAGVGAGTAAQIATLRPYRNATTTSTEIENLQIISGPNPTNFGYTLLLLELFGVIAQ